MNIITTHEDAKSGVELTPDEVQLLRDYRCLSAEAKQYAQAYMNIYAGKCPSKKPALRLIPGGAA